MRNNTPIELMETDSSRTSERRMAKVDFSTSVHLIENTMCLAKTIVSDARDFKRWLYLLQQLKFPQSYRPVKPLSHDVNRSIIYDCVRGQWYERIIIGERGRPKPTQYTKKLPTTLLPPKVNINLFYRGFGEKIGLLFDISKCKVNASYIFSANAYSDHKPWLYRESILPDFINFKNRPPRAIALETLEHQLNNSSEVLAHNEILARLSKESLIGVFYVDNTLESRAAALALKAVTQDMLKIDLPILNIASGTISQYSASSQLDDLKVAFDLHANSSARQYAQVALDYGDLGLGLVSHSRYAMQVATFPKIAIPPNEILKLIASYLDQSDWFRMATWCRTPELELLIHHTLPPFLYRMIKNVIVVSRLTLPAHSVNSTLLSNDKAFGYAAICTVNRQSVYNLLEAFHGDPEGYRRNLDIRCVIHGESHTLTREKHNEYNETYLVHNIKQYNKLSVITLNYLTFASLINPQVADIIYAFDPSLQLSAMKQLRQIVQVFPSVPDSNCRAVLALCPQRKCDEFPCPETFAFRALFKETSFNLAQAESALDFVIGLPEQFRSNQMAIDVKASASTQTRGPSLFPSKQNVADATCDAKLEHNPSLQP